MTTKYSTELATAISTALIDELDSEGPSAWLRLTNSAGVTLAEIPLDNPCGTVNPLTGTLTFAVAGRDESADASGTAAFGQLLTAGYKVQLQAPVRQGTSAQPGYFTMVSTYIQAGQPVEAFSMSYRSGELI